MPPLTLSHSTTTVPLNSCRIGRLQDDDPDGVVGRTRRCRCPVPVGAELSDGGVGGGCSRDEVLVVGIAEVGNVVGAEQQLRRARGVRDDRLRHRIDDPRYSCSGAGAGRRNTRQVEVASAATARPTAVVAPAFGGPRCGPPVCRTPAGSPRQPDCAVPMGSPSSRTRFEHGAVVPLSIPVTASTLPRRTRAAQTSPGWAAAWSDWADTPAASRNSSKADWIRWVNNSASGSVLAQPYTAKLSMSA